MLKLVVCLNLMSLHQNLPKRKIKQKIMEKNREISLLGKIYAKDLPGECTRVAENVGFKSKEALTESEVRKQKFTFNMSTKVKKDQV